MKNMKKFKHNGCNPKFTKPLQWIENKETLNLFRYSLYIEDEYTHKVFNNLGNRFYEALMCRVVQFFDCNCKGTITRSGLNLDPFFYVGSRDELLEKIKICDNDWGQYWDKQKKWIHSVKSQRADMIKQLKCIINGQETLHEQ